MGDHIRYRDKGKEWRTGYVKEVVGGRPKAGRIYACFHDEVEHTAWSRDCRRLIC